MHKEILKAKKDNVCIRCIGHNKETGKRCLRNACCRLGCEFVCWQHAAMFGGSYLPGRSCTVPERSLQFKLARHSRTKLTENQSTRIPIVVIDQGESRDCVIYALLAFFSNKKTRDKREAAIRKLLGPNTEGGYRASEVLEKIESFYNLRHVLVATFLPRDASKALKEMLREYNQPLRMSEIILGEPDTPKHTATEIKDEIEQLQPTRFLIVTHWSEGGVRGSHLSVLKQREKHGKWIYIDSVGEEPYSLKTFVKNCNDDQTAFQVIALVKEGDENLLRAVKVEVKDKDVKYKVRPSTL